MYVNNITVEMHIFTPFCSTNLPIHPPITYMCSTHHQFMTVYSILGGCTALLAGKPALSIELGARMEILSPTVCLSNAALSQITGIEISLEHYTSYICMYFTGYLALPNEGTEKNVIYG